MNKDNQEMFTSKVCGLLHCSPQALPSSHTNILEGEIFVLPSRIPHSPQRFQDTVGLVIERERLPTEIDALRYWTPTDPHQILYQECFHCFDLGVQLKPVIQRYFGSEQYKTGHPPPGPSDPSKEGQHELPYPLDLETKVIEPFSLSNWISAREEKIANGSIERMFGGTEKDEFQINVHGPSGDKKEEKTTNEGETLFWQWKGSSKISTDGGNTLVKEGEYYLLKPNTTYSTSVSFLPLLSLSVLNPSRLSSTPWTFVLSYFLRKLTSFLFVETQGFNLHRDYHHSSTIPSLNGFSKQTSSSLS
jgi:hypothetical protein